MDLKETEYDPSIDFTIDKRPIIMVKKLVNTFLIKLESLKKELKINKITIHFVTGARGGLARYVHGTKTNPHFVMSTRIIYQAAKKHGVNLGFAIYSTLIHELCHAYLDSLELDPSEHDEDFIEEITKNFCNDNNPKKLKQKLDWFAGHSDVYYFNKRHKIEEIEYPLAKGDDLQAYAGMEGWKGKLVWMDPDKFLGLAIPLNDKEKSTLSLMDLEMKMKAGKPLDFLVLVVDMNKRKVVGHEGRHRATIAKKLGIEKVPVLIYVGSGYKRVPDWDPEDHEIADKQKFRSERDK